MNNSIFIVKSAGKRFLFNMDTMKVIMASKERIDLINNGVYKKDVVLMNFLTENVEIKNGKIRVSPLLILNYNCNYQCTYCYERESKKEQISFSEEYFSRIDKFYDEIFLLSNLEWEYESISVMGGEPFLLENYTIIKSLLRHWQGIRVIFTTNGTNIDLYKDLIKNNNVSIKVSIDGTKSMHYKYRLTKEEGAYEKTISGIKWLIEMNIPVTLMTVFHPEFIIEYTEYFNLLEEIGVKIGENVSVNFLPIYQNGCSDVDISYFKECINTINIIKKLDKRIYKVNLLTLYPGATVLDAELRNSYMGKSKNLFRCKVYDYSFTFMPTGEVQLCNMIQNENGKIGEFYPSIKFEKNKFEKYRTYNLFTYEECKKCKYKWGCKSGCIATSLNGNKKEQCGFWKNKEIITELDNFIDFSQYSID